MKSKYKITKEHRENISVALTGRTLSNITRNKMKGRIPWNKGLMGLKLGVKKGTKFSPEHIKKLILAKLGTKQSKETIEKRKRAYKKIGLNKREKNGNWNGGSSFHPYSVDWTETLRRSIRERDKYICQVCEIPQGDITHHVHHIDYNKKNCDPKNLITLCRRCHNKTLKNRTKWTKYFIKPKL